MAQAVERALTGLFSVRSQKNVRDLHKEYPTDASAYELLEDCGRGVSATVYRAYCKEFDEIVAVKKMNLESVQNDLDEIVHEAQLMKNYNHPNVLPLYTSFVDNQDLWMVVPFIAGGSVLHIIKYAHPEGLDEVVIATIMRDVLKALDYVHRQGGIHRDIKAGNILVDKDGCVKLGDFGVATSLERTGSWGHDKNTRMTFVGTPCWMAPEVMEQTAGYDNAADIWSFGISMLEMAHGHAPFAKYPPMKVLLMTLQNPPPSLEDKGKKHFSKAMRDVVQKCLQKDPRLRPTAGQLLEHKFFKQARDQEFLARFLMADLPPLGDRVQEIRQGKGKAATLGADNERDFAKSQEEYKKGVSSWNFDVAALKAQADLEGDDREPMLPTITEGGEGEEAATLSGLNAVDAAAFMSAFATQDGQAAVMDAATRAAVHPSNVAADARGSGSVSEQAEPSSGPLSPAGGMSPIISREGSVQGLLPAESKNVNVKHKTKGRFSVYDEGDVPPPMSPSAPTMVVLSAAPAVIQESPEEELATSLTQNLPVAQESGDPGTSREDKTVSFSVITTEETVDGQPKAKTKGRFTVIENSTGAIVERRQSEAGAQAVLTKSSSMTRNASDGLREKDAGSKGGSAGLPAMVLPKLQELLDQVSLQQSDLRKLVALVQDSERQGRLQKSDSVEELRAAFEQMQQRVADADAENARLRTRNAQLELLLSGNGNSHAGAVAFSLGPATPPVLPPSAAPVALGLPPLPRMANPAVVNEEHN